VSFLYKVVSGAAQKSYGLYVAKLAGLPLHVVQRAGEFLTDWQQEKSRPIQRSRQEKAEQPGKNPNRAIQAILNRLREIDPLRTTPMEALFLLVELRKLAEEGQRET